MKDLTFAELAGYTAAETRRWRDWLASQPPEILDLPIGTGRTATVRGLIHHIIVVERRYIDRLRGEPVMAYESVPKDPAAEMFRWFEEGRAQLDAWLASAPESAMANRLKFETISAGTLEASARKVIAHLFMHGVRHWAQLATSLRQQGYATDWHHDILMSDALD